MVVHKYTQDELVEILWTLDDPIPFMLHAQMQTMVGNKKFEPYLFQLDLVDHIQRNTYSIINSNRQAGVTTTLGLYALWKAATKQDQTIIIASDRLATAREWSDRIDYAAEHLPPHLRPTFVRRNKDDKQFDNGSRILFRAISSSMGRGLHFGTLILDNAAYAMPQAMNDFWTSIYPVMACGLTQVIIASTPAKPEGVFYDVWSKAPNNGFARMTIPWHAVPGRSYDWYDAMKAAIGEEAMHNQYGNLFEGQGTLLTANAS